MNYYFTTIVNENFITIETKVMSLLKEQGFGVLTTIDMQQILKNKLNIDFRKYKVLGACNPHFAYSALELEDKIGTLLPCNIILQEIAPNSIEVSAVNPIISMQSVNNEQLKNVANEVSSRLGSLIKSINDEK